MPSEEVTHIRRRTIRSLAAPYRQSNRDGCSPQICLALFGLFVAAIGTVFGMFFFSMQFRKYNVWLGGQLEWRCSLVVCSLRYARPSSLMERALDKVLQKQYASPEMEQWATDFCNGKVELFPTLWNLNFCENKGLHSVQYKLFGAFCEHSPYSGKYIDGKIWGIMRYTSRAAFSLALLSLLATLMTAAFLMKDHQTCARTKKPRWAVSEEKTGKFRPYVKICAGLAPLLLALAAVQYRWCLATFELYGGIPKQTTLVGLMGSESSEVSVAWAVVLLFAVSLLEGAMAAALLAGPLRRPERPLGLDIFDTCMDVQLERRKGKEVELSAMKASPASPGRGAESSAGAPRAKAPPPQAAPAGAGSKGTLPQSPRPYAPPQNLPPPNLPQPPLPYPPQQLQRPRPMRPGMMGAPLHLPGQILRPKASLPDLPPGIIPSGSPRQHGDLQARVPPNWANTTMHTSS